MSIYFVAVHSYAAENRKKSLKTLILGVQGYLRSSTLIPLKSTSVRGWLQLAVSTNCSFTGYDNEPWHIRAGGDFLAEFFEKFIRLNQKIRLIFGLAEFCREIFFGLSYD